MNVELRVGQLLCCTREHFGLGPAGIFVMNVGDLVVVVETTSYCQGRCVRLADAVEISILTLDELSFDDVGNFIGTKLPTYEVLQ